MLPTSVTIPKTGMLGNIVSFPTSTSTISLKTSAFTQIASITLSYGIWLVILKVDFNSSSTCSARSLIIQNSSTAPATPSGVQYSITDNTSIPSGYQSSTLTSVIPITTSTTYYAFASASFTSGTVSVNLSSIIFSATRIA